MGQKSTEQVIHDMLLHVLPPGTHDTACHLCTTDHQEDTMPELTEAQLQDMVKQACDAAVAAATAPLEARIAELTSTAANEAQAQALAEAVDAAVTAAVAEKDAELATVRTELDTAVAAQTAAEASLTATTEYLAAENAVAEKDALTVARRAEVEALGIFASKPEHIDANLERWVAMDADEWASHIEGWTITAQAIGSIKPKPLPTGATALAGGDVLKDAEDANPSPIRAVMRHIANGAPVAALS